MDKDKEIKRLEFQIMQLNDHILRLGRQLEDMTTRKLKIGKILQKRKDSWWNLKILMATETPHGVQIVVE